RASAKKTASTQGSRVIQPGRSQDKAHRTASCREDLEKDRAPPLRRGHYRSRHEVWKPAETGSMIDPEQLEHAFLIASGDAFNVEVGVAHGACHQAVKHCTHDVDAVVQLFLVTYAAQYTQGFDHACTCTLIRFLNQARNMRIARRLGQNFELERSFVQVEDARHAFGDHVTHGL